MTARDVRDHNGQSLLGIAARLVIVSMQYATLDSAQHIMVLSLNSSYTWVLQRTCCMLSSSNHDFRILVHLLQVWSSGCSEILVCHSLLVWHSLPISHMRRNSQVTLASTTRTSGMLLVSTLDITSMLCMEN